METDIILESAKRVEQTARKWVYHLGNDGGEVDVDELRDALALVRDLAQVVVELATRVGEEAFRVERYSKQA